MLIFLFAIIVLSLVGAKFSGANEFHKDYLSKETTTAVNGLFVLLVFLKHVSDQLSLNGNVFDKAYYFFGQEMGQLIVVTFLFYSGYGITYSIIKKGAPYVRIIPKNRFLKVLIHFDMAVMLYILLNLIIGEKMKFADILLSLVGWSAVGNSNWYIFSIMVLYLITFISFTVCKSKIYASLVMNLAMIFGFIALMFSVRRPAYFYNTLICYGFGTAFCVFKEKIEKYILNSDTLYTIVLSIVAVSFLIVHNSKHVKTFTHSLWAVLFVTLIVLLSMKLKIGNGLLDYFGKRVFFIYILQRIPMIVFKKIPLIFNSRYVYVGICFFCTLVLAELFSKLTKRVDEKILKTQ